MVRHGSILALMAAGFVGGAVVLSVNAVSRPARIYAQGDGDKTAELQRKYEELERRQAETQQQVSWLSRTSPPVGTVMAFAGEWPPARGEGGRWTEEELGWLLCDGRPLRKSDFPELFAVIRTSHGNGSHQLVAGQAQPTTVNGFEFNLPDTRGLFLRGVDTFGRDPDREGRVPVVIGGNSGNRVGTFQGHAFASHNHTIVDNGHSHTMGPFMGPNLGNGYDSGDARSAWAWYGAPNRSTSVDKTNITINNTGGNETRPQNVTVHWIIKFK